MAHKSRQEFESVVAMWREEAAEIGGRRVEHTLVRGGDGGGFMSAEFSIRCQRDDATAIGEAGRYMAITAAEIRGHLVGYVHPSDMSIRVMITRALDEYDPPAPVDEPTVEGAAV